MTLYLLHMHVYQLSHPFTKLGAANGNIQLDEFVITSSTLGSFGHLMKNKGFGVWNHAVILSKYGDELTEEYCASDARQ